MFSKHLCQWKHYISNLQMLLDSSRFLQHKKYQMQNQINFAKHAAPEYTPPKHLEKIEIQTRILKLLHQSELIDIKQFNFADDIRKKYYLDSLDITVLVSSIEEEFNTIFDPDTYEKARSLDIIVEALHNDPAIV